MAPIVNFTFSVTTGAHDWALGLSAISDGYACVPNTTALGTKIQPTSDSIVELEADGTWHAIANADGIDNYAFGVQCVPGIVWTQNWVPVGLQQLSVTAVVSGWWWENMPFSLNYDALFLQGSQGTIVPGASGVAITAVNVQVLPNVTVPELAPWATTAQVLGNVTVHGLALGTSQSPCWPGKTEFACPSLHPTPSLGVGPGYGYANNVVLASGTDKKVTLCGFNADWGPHLSPNNGCSINYNATNVTLQSMDGNTSCLANCMQP